MNQLEFFVASTECARSEVRRYLRQLRELDELIEYHLDCLRYVTEQRVAQLAAGEDNVDGSAAPAGTSPAASAAAPVMSSNSTSSGDQRRRGASPTKVAPTAARSHRGRESGADSSPLVLQPELLAALSSSASSSVRSGLLDPAVSRLTGLVASDQRAAYTFHRTRAMRHAEERRVVAAELAERSMELKGAMAVRLAQFEQGVEDGAGR